MKLELNELRVDAGSGPGSRGGHVIGKTSSGKPIYMSANHPAHTGFNVKEHREAASLHRGKMQFPGQTRDMRGRPTDAMHHEAAQDHARAANKLEKGG